MGEVYLARDARLGRPVALKVLAPARRAATSASASGCCASRGSRRASTTRTSSRSTRPARPTAACSSRCATSTGTTCKALLRRERPARARARGRDRRPDRRRARRRPPRAASCTATSSRATSCSTAQDDREHCYLADFGLTQSSPEPRAGRRAVHGHGRLRRARADPRRRRRRARRPVRARLPALRVPHRARCRSAHRSDVAAIFAHLEEPPPAASERDAGAAAGASTPSWPAAWPRSPAERFESCRRGRGRGATALGLGRAAAAPPRGSCRCSRSPWPSRSPCSRPSRLLRGDGAGARRRPHGRAHARRPAHERGRRAHADRRPSRAARGHAGRDLDGRLPRRRPVALRARRRPRRSASPPTASRATSPRSATRSTSPPTGAASRASVARYDAVDRRARGQRRPAGLRDRVRRGRRVGGRLPVRAAAEHRRRPAAEAARDLPAVPAPGDASRTRASSSASSRSAPARCGCSGTRSTAASGGSTPARGELQATIELGFPPTSAAVADGAVWITDGLHDRVVPSTRDRPAARADPGRPRGARRRRRRRRRCGWRTRSTARSRAIDPRTRRVVVATVDVGGRAARVAVGADGGLGDRACALARGRSRLRLAAALRGAAARLRRTPSRRCGSAWSWTASASFRSLRGRRALGRRSCR